MTDDFFKEKDKLTLLREENEKKELEVKDKKRKTQTEIKYEAICEDYLVHFDKKKLVEKFGLSIHRIIDILNKPECRDYMEKRRDDARAENDQARAVFVKRVLSQAIKELELRSEVSKHAEKLQQGIVPKDLMDIVDFSIRRSQNKKGESSVSTRFEKTMKGSLIETVFKAIFANPPQKEGESIDPDSSNSLEGRLLRLFKEPTEEASDENGKP